MAIFKEVWMAARSNDERNSYRPLGYATTEEEAVSLCSEWDDFVCLYNNEDTPVGTPLPGYWPIQGETEPQ